MYVLWIYLLLYYNYICNDAGLLSIFTLNCSRQKTLNQIVILLDCDIITGGWVDVSQICKMLNIFQGINAGLTSQTTG